MRFNPLPGVRLYWSNDRNFFNSIVAQVMPVKRFLKIMKILHLNDNYKIPKKGEIGFERLYKLEPMLDHLYSCFKKLFHPARYLSVDEYMVGFKGRRCLEQYMPNKPIKRGFKIWVIACAGTGYCLGPSVYEGKEEGGNSYKFLGEFVIEKLAAPYERLGNCLFFDNFFSNVVMMKNLLRKNLFACATIRQTRKFFPKDKLAADKTLKMGESDIIIGEDIGISKWKGRGKKCVTVTSTMCNAESKCFVLRTNNKGVRESVPCPESIRD
ncbi:piggyBac transposable element-derived protein 3-like [Schistocerca serialis cubense]|uniref:piggyBac transposable element-derived protein 3-like n=1 Tax=Schistocerca serialis cubense TaxID=2023355 RepID=UPI00214E602C|nr:piggyBac transposable element-derived protein 3-like [Schistocerca serialis cubense]